MKRKNYINKAIVMIAISLCIIGGILMSIGFSNNATFGIRIDNHGFVSIAKWMTPEAQKTQTLFTANKENTSLTLTGNCQGIKMVKGDTFSVQGSSELKQQMHFNEQNGMITMEINTRDLILTFNDEQQDIIVTIPDTIKNINMDMNMADVELHNITLESITARFEVGSLEMQNVITNTADIDINAGDFELHGDILISLYVDVEMGDADISLVRTQKDYNYDVSAELGDLAINEMERGGISPSFYEKNNATATIRAQINAGDLEIETR